MTKTQKDKFIKILMAAIKEEIKLQVSDHWLELDNRIGKCWEEIIKLENHIESLKKRKSSPPKPNKNLSTQ